MSERNLTLMSVMKIALRSSIILMMGALVCVVGLQVFARFLLPRAPSWTEELARFFMLYLVALSAGYAYYEKYYVNIDLILHSKKLPKAVYYIQMTLVCSIVVISMILIAIYSIPMMKLGTRQTSSVLFIPMIFIFAVMAIIPLNILIAQALQLYGYIMKRKRGRV